MSLTHNVFNDNLSDHVPLFLQINEKYAEYLSFKHRSASTKLAWYKASDKDITKYKHRLLLGLVSIMVPNEALSCRNHHHLFVSDHEDP